MPRIARIVAVGLPHHITQRGNYKQDVFLNSYDYLKYLSWIQEYSNKHELSILAYCLMPNHVHFIVVPKEKESLAKVFNVAHMRYSQYFNNRLRSKGHLWQGRFYSCVLSELHLIAAAVYIERNPVRAKLVKKPWQWKWSSAIPHINKSKSLIKLDNLFNLIDVSPSSWKQYIDSKENEKAIDALRRNTLAGRPLGNITFIQELEKRLGRKLVTLPKGRPRKYVTNK